MSKQGNVDWVRCRACGQWWPVSDEFLKPDRRGVPLCCPHCGAAQPLDES